MADLPEPVGQGDLVVQPGDSIVSIAARAGLLPDTLWNDAANAALKEARKTPEVLLPGDRVTVMDPRPKLASGATGKRWVFRRKGLLVTLTLYVQDEGGEAFGGKAYELLIDGHKTTGTTDADGKIECSIHATSESGTLSVWLDEPGLPNPWIRQLRLASLHPVEHPIGIQQRLANLGYYSGPLDGSASEQWTAAIAAFQKAEGLEATSVVDAALQAKLTEIHKV